MSRAYTAGLRIEENIKITKRRELPLLGEVLVKVGEQVKANQNVLRAELAGELDIIKLEERLGLEPEKIASGLKVQKGDNLKEKDLICEIPGFLGLFNTKYFSTINGKVEFFTPVNAHLGIRKQSEELNVRAFIDGKVVAVEDQRSVTIETEGALFQGIFGVGGERLGEIFLLEIENNKKVTIDFLKNMNTGLENKILIGGSSFDSEALHYCSEKNVKGIFTASIEASTLKNFVGYEIGVPITGDEALPFTLIISEGFGELPLSERVSQLARKLQNQTASNKTASISGATQVRAGAIRPELIVSNSLLSSSTAINVERNLVKGASVRIIRLPYFGQFGNIIELPQQAQLIPTGAEVRVAKIKLLSGEEVIVPRSNLELC